MLKILIINHTHMPTATKKIIKNAADDANDINSMIDQVIDHATQAKKMYTKLDPKMKKKIFQGIAAAAATIAAIGLMKKMAAKKKGR